MPEAWASLAALAARLAPPHCHWGEADPRRLYPVLPGESLQAMRPKRAAEFSAGRFAARAALRAGGLDDQVAIVQGADRAPCWPPGLAGSISHSDRACLAVVSAHLAALGLDLEPLQHLPPEVAREVQLPGDSVSGWGQGPQLLDPALLVFCAKEAAYKAQYALTGQLIGPEALAIELNGTAFCARLTQPVAQLPQGYQLPGRLDIAAGHVLALAWIAPPAPM